MASASDSRAERLLDEAQGAGRCCTTAHYRIAVGADEQTRNVEACLISMAAATPSLLFASRMSISTRLGRTLPASSIAISAVAAGPTTSWPNFCTTHSISSAAQSSSSTIRIFCLADKDARRPRSEPVSSRSQMPAVRPVALCGKSFIMLRRFHFPQVVGPSTEAAFSFFVDAPQSLTPQHYGVAVAYSKS